jgi:hypothetical protein
MTELVFVAGRRAERWRDLDAWRESDIDDNAGRFRSGIDVWIVQTYLHVRDALAADGWSVRLSDRFAPGAICVAHWDELHRLRLRAPRSYLVGVRADRPPLLVADWVVRQNALLADDDHLLGLPGGEEVVQLGEVRGERWGGGVEVDEEEAVPEGGGEGAQAVVSAIEAAGVLHFRASDEAAIQLEAPGVVGALQKAGVAVGLG